jgi:hypothetical protein
LRRKLWLVDITLLVLICLVTAALRQRWLEGREREQALLRQMAPVAGPPVLAPLPLPTPSTAAQYLQVAQQMVFSRDRNPDVILDPPAPAPPPKPMPPFPVAYGVMNLGEGPTAILSEKPGAQHHGYRAGEKIGEFKLVALNNKEIVLEWEGKYVKKTIEELTDRRPIVLEKPAEAAPQAAAPAATPVTTVAEAKGPGSTDMGKSSRACVAGDTLPAGTVQDGLRKVISKTPFGDSCRWEPVK